MAQGEEDGRWRLQVYWADGSHNDWTFDDGKPERTTTADGRTITYTADQGAQVLELQAASIRAVRLTELAGT